MEAACRKAGLRFAAAPHSLSTDNAAMIAFAAGLRFNAGFVSSVSEEIDPNLALA
jgi:N6-L-threonylcarbamoyladenine synthase